MNTVTFSIFTIYDVDSDRGSLLSHNQTHSYARMHTHIRTHTDI